MLFIKHLLRVLKKFNFENSVRYIFMFLFCSTVDNNEAYDNINIRNQDEEEKYFDSESPETVLMENVRDENDSEDELDMYMRSLKVK